MQSIALPKKIEIVKGAEPNQGQVVIEPLFPGYGITLGNSLRRVLLSSLPGAAAIGIKIEGANHEFTALPHLQEDILEFTLNLKKLRLKVFTDEVEKLELEVHGTKEFTAGDIKKNANVMIANPDLVLGHITDMAGSFKGEILVSQGMGYEMIESREESKNEIGYIEMDSIFSPIVSVGLKIENIRVGKMTNWDKLILDIVTDGTITPEEAFKKSVSILLEQYHALEGTEVPVMLAAEAEETETAVDEEQEAAETNEDDGGDEEKSKKKRGRPKKGE